MNKDEKIKALIVDDESHIRALVKAILTSMSAEIVGEASNGQEAIALYQQKKPNVVLMDINMPVMSGLTALEKITEIDPDAFVIMLTSLSDSETVRACVEAGAAGYFRKDTPVAELRKSIHEVWDQYVNS